MQVCLSLHDLLFHPARKSQGNEIFVKQKITELKLVNWSSKNELIVERMRMSRFLLHLLIYLWSLFYFGTKSHKIEHTFKTHD